MNDHEDVTIRSSLNRAAGTGAMYLGPGDVYRFLVTGADTAGAYFAMEAIVAPGGGPPPHIHRHEDETFYVVEGQCSILLGEEWITAGVGDFVNVPRGTVHRFENQGTETMRMILTSHRPASRSSSRKRSSGRWIRRPTSPTTSTRAPPATPRRRHGTASSFSSTAILAPRSPQP